MGKTRKKATDVQKRIRKVRKIKEKYKKKCCKIFKNWTEIQKDMISSREIFKKLDNDRTKE